MNSLNLSLPNIKSLRDLLRRREISAVELCNACLSGIESLDPLLNTFISLNPRLLEEAQEWDDNPVEKPLGGIPLGIKDLILTRGLPTTAGSAVSRCHPFQGNEATLVRRLRRSGALILGKNNLHEFAYGVTSENEAFGPVRNPWNVDSIAGGSSGGSAAAVAARFCVGAVGTDTRGSIRIPAACCGVTGLKPTFNSVPTRGVIPLCWSLDHAGPLAGSVEDVEILLEVLAPARANPDIVASHQLKVGIISPFLERLAPSVEKAFEEAVNTLQRAGVTFRDIEVTGLETVLEASDIIARAEAVVYHHDLLNEFGDRYGKARERLLSGYQLTAFDLVRAYRQKEAFARIMREVFREVHCLASPTLAVPAPRLGTREISTGGVSESVVQCLVRMTAPFNMAGIPAMSLPCGFSRDGMPVSLQLAAWRGREPLLLSVGKLYQKLTDWHRWRPEILDRRHN